jgi:tetratricopeptide (TPR) repeat protein
MFNWIRLAALAVFLLLSQAPALALAEDAPSRVVTAFLDSQPLSIPLLPEEKELLTQAVMTLTQQGGFPGRRRMVWRALQGLEDGNAKEAAKALLTWQKEGELIGFNVSRQVAVVVGLGDIDRVHAAFRVAMNENSGDPNNWFLLGHALLRKDKTELAVMAFNQVQLLADLSGDTMYAARAGVRLGSIYLKDGQLREAKAQLADAANVLTDSPHQDEAAAARNDLAKIYVLRAKQQLQYASDLFEAGNNINKAVAARERMGALEALYPK